MDPMGGIIQTVINSYVKKPGRGCYCRLKFNQGARYRDMQGSGSNHVEYRKFTTVHLAHRGLQEYEAIAMMQHV